MSSLRVVSTGGGDAGTPRRKYYVDPKAGMYSAVCVDVIDLGFIKNKFNKVTRKIQFAFQLGATVTEKMIVAAKKAKGLSVELDEDDTALVGTRLLIRGKRMSLSLFPGGDQMKASDLYSFLEDWNGVPFTKPTKANPLDIDPEDFVGKNATLMVVRSPSKSDPSIVYANIAAIQPPDEEAEVLEIDDTYTRVADRDNFTPPPTQDDVVAPPVATTAKAAPVEEFNDDDDEVEIPYEKAA